jgi:glyoxylase-like metal-dependent hydrolase (beta-lactamase superfamily II)
MTLSRRHFLGVGMALGAAWLARPLSAIAAAAKATTLAPGITRVTLGKATITTIHDGFFVRPLDDKFVRNVAFSEVQKALADAGLPIDKLEVPFTPVVADIGNERVLFDCGNGEFGAATAGKLLENMAKAGIAPDSITAVVFSHFHGDHINGLRNKAGALAFPKAKIFVPAPEWGFWMDDAKMAAAPEAMKGNFNAVRRVFGPIVDTLKRFEPGTELLPGLRSIAAFGHTPGHTVFTVDGGAQKLLYWADTTNVASLFVRNPDWAVMFDMDAEAARITRRKLADMVIAEKMLVAGYHLPGSAIGTLATRGTGYEFTPLAG